jgi:hypothetical protein
MRSYSYNFGSMTDRLSGDKFPVTALCEMGSPLAGGAITFLFAFLQRC